jgi:hypothetical protein
MASDKKPYWAGKPWSVRWRVLKMAYGYEPILPEGQDPPDLTGRDLLTRMEWHPVIERLKRSKQGENSQE